MKRRTELIINPLKMGKYRFRFKFGNRVKDKFSV